MTSKPSRWSIYWRIAVRPAWFWLVAVPFALLGVFQAIREEAPVVWQDELRLPSFIDWPWTWFAIIALIAAVLIVMESARRVIATASAGATAVDDGSATKPEALTPKHEIEVLIDEGRELQGRAVAQGVPPPTMAVANWGARVEPLLFRLFGNPHAELWKFNFLKGNSEQGFSGMSTRGQIRLWREVTAGLEGLEEFVKGL